MKNILIYIAIFAASLLAAFASRADTYEMLFGGTCFQPGDADLLTQAFGRFDIEIVESANAEGYAIIQIIGEEGDAVAAIMPTTDICVLWTSSAPKETF